MSYLYCNDIYFFTVQCVISSSSKFKIILFFFINVNEKKIIILNILYD